MASDVTTEVIGMMDIPGSMEIARRVCAIGGVSPCLNAHASDTIPKVLVEVKTNV